MVDRTGTDTTHQGIHVPDKMTLLSQIALHGLCSGEVEASPLTDLKTVSFVPTPI